MSKLTDWNIPTRTLLTQSMPDGSIRKLVARAAYDLRPAPDGHDYGIHGVELEFEITRGKVGVYCLWMTPFFRKETRAKIEATPGLGMRRWEFDGLGAFGYHSPARLNEWEEPQKGCEITGGDCYGSSSASYSGAVFDKFVADPEELWIELERKLVEVEREIADVQALIRNNG